MLSLIPERASFGVLKKPFYFLLFFYFLTISAELLHFRALIFKFKINAFVGVLLFTIYFLAFRILRLDKDFLAAALACLGSMLLSALFGYHIIGCIGFLLFFVFNYLVFFVLPVNLFRTLNPDLVLRFYFLSFVVIGAYAAAQVIVSLFGVYLPFTGQRILSLGRGQGFSYEPSYYALYMTPYTMFQTTKFFLQESKNRNMKEVLLSNFFLIVSTSTGCFFSYMALVGSLIGLKFANLVRRISLMKVFYKAIFSSAILFGCIWIFNSTLIIAGFLKFFWVGMSHHSFQDRWQGILSFWNVFLDNPLLGTGLGGATSYIIQKEGMDISYLDQNILNINGPMNITLEVMGSLGLFGMVAFGGFLVVLARTCLATLREQLAVEERINVQAFIVSLLVMFFTMQFNPSIMRAYSWLHVAICVGYMKFLLRKYKYGS